MSNQTKRQWHLVAALLVIGSIAACVTNATHPLVYGPAFRFYEPTEITDVMHRLANGVQSIDAALHTETRDAATQAEVLRHLADMEVAAKELALQGQAASNHPLFDRHLADLRDRLTEARIAVEGEPPDYFLVGTITGTCLSCHQKRQLGGAASVDSTMSLRVENSLAWATPDH